jgi:hypothetical protein
MNESIIGISLTAGGFFLALFINFLRTGFWFGIREERIKTIIATIDELRDEIEENRKMINTQHTTNKQLYVNKELSEERWKQNDKHWIENRRELDDRWLLHHRVHDNFEDRLKELERNIYKRSR